MDRILIHKMRCKIKMGGRLSGEKLLHSALLDSDNLKSALLQGFRNKTAKISLRLNTLELNLGAISVAQFDTQFNQLLAQAFAQCLAREHATIGGPQEMNLQTPDITAFQDWLHECHPGEKELFQRAQGCLQPATLKSLIQDSPAYQLQQLLKLLLDGGWQSPKVLPVFWYGRVTASRLSIAAALYLLNSQRGHDWLMHQHSPTASQVTGWAKAIARGEIPPEQVAQLLTGNRASDSALPDQRAYSPLVVMRWLLPLWRQPAVRQAIHRLKGGRGVQHLDAYLSRCLQRQEDDAMREGKGMQSDAGQVALPRDNAISPNAPRSSSQGISNAGLLLLWPLLPQLFSQLSLWEEEQFVSDAARWQAVYGLDRLVWGEVSPTEERLTLNQVLCGVSCSASVPPPAPLSLLQQQQIDDWLASIGQQLPGWQKLSLTDIRQLFLQRAGKISTQGAVPQISVWPEPYDFLLRDWPWPMTLASFPWTEQPLTIVWPLTDFTG
ncbi:contractile injection system tape measure protein [Serratia plymuthica]|uniref:Uncharacterized protein n=1 Tax=Serratia plymuthica TaxID=82996 RepID=A0A7T2WB94_SERPL|nr:contractile injection system tape measure protein [Serratia plymuthica]QPS20158.1 hypothetical protein I6G64_21775 [Serratia plymuthica]QPS61773.1 hypothetical protein I6G52_17035 [Serratia plymuthica]RKS61139.1 hypothetical protein C8E17_0249 [Serratia plymuthica]